MKTRLIEATNGPNNWGKFMVGKFDDQDWQHPSAVDDARPLLRSRGHHDREVLVMDLETCEGVIVRAGPGAHAGADLQKHRVWVCPLFEPFLQWLYAQDLTTLDTLPALVDLPNAPFDMHGYRRPGEA